MNSIVPTLYIVIVTVNWRCVLYHLQLTKAVYAFVNCCSWMGL